MAPAAVKVSNLCYKYPGNAVGLRDVNLEFAWNSRVLLVGCNGAGKSTLLKLLAGRTLCTSGAVLVDGEDPFRKSTASSTTYLGTEWASNPIVRRDIKVSVLIESIGGDYYHTRRDELLRVLEIDLDWHMNEVSDGQRRRVQLCMGLMKPWKLLLLDEVTVDLDVLVRDKLLDFLKRECAERDCCVFYATHIFDGLGDWATHVVHITKGAIAGVVPAGDIAFTGSEVVEREHQLLVPKTNSLHPLALQWLRADDAE